MCIYIYVHDANCRPEVLTESAGRSADTPCREGGIFRAPFKASIEVPVGLLLGFRGLGFRGVGFRDLGFRGLGFRGVGFRDLAFRVSSCGSAWGSL